MKKLLLIAVISVFASAVLAKTVRSYYIGNSVTDTIRYDQLRQLAESRGNANQWGRQMIPGSPLDNLWNSKDGGFQQPPYGYPTNALPYYDWDALSLQPFDRSLDSDTNAISNFINLGLPRNSNAQVYVYSRWPRTSNFLPDYDTTWLTNSGDTSSGYKQECRDFFEKVTRALRDQWVTNIALPVRIVPCGDVLYALSQKIKAGQVAGFTDIVQMYADGIHFNDTGAYLVACTYYATMYKDNPIGLIATPYNLANGTPLVSIIQSTVWEVVSTHQYAGVIPEILPLGYDQTVPEGSTTAVKVKLTDAPAGVTTVSVTRIAGDTDISVSGGATLVFTPANYSAWQTVTLAAAEDGDFYHGSATIQCSGAGVASCQFKATEKDNDANAVCYDGFDVPAQPIHRVYSGYGWLAGWYEQNSKTNQPGYDIAAKGLTYPGLVTKGRAAVGGNAYETCGRALNVITNFAPWAQGGYIGKDGTELWMSYLVRLTNATYQGKISLGDNSGLPFSDVGRLRVYNTGGKWNLTAMSDSIVSNTAVTVQANTTYLMVLRFQFGASTDRVDLYVNPAPGAALPAVADATVNVSTNVFRISNLSWYPQSSPNSGWLDEIRFGNSFDNVTPAIQQVFTNGNNIAVNGLAENDERSGYSIIFTGTISGTGTFATTDGVTNSFVGNVTPGFSPGELVIDKGDGVVNLGLADDPLMLNIENGDSLVLTNFPGPVDLSTMDVTFYSPTTLGTTNWFLYSTSGIQGAFNNTNYVLYTYGAVIYDGANNRVGVLIVPEPAAALALAALALVACRKR